MTHDCSSRDEQAGCFESNSKWMSRDEKKREIERDGEQVGV